MVTSDDTGRLSDLRQAKVRALVGDHWRVEGPPETGHIPGGATLYEGSLGRGWVLLDDGAVSGFGAALAWAHRRSCSQLHVLVEDRGRESSGIVARRSVLFNDPPTVWRVDRRSLHPAVPAPAVSVSVPSNASVDQVPTDVLDGLSAEIAAHGAIPVIEHGTLHGEVLGLEVVRVVADGDGGWRLSVGVGLHDRQAREGLRPDELVGRALEDTVALVRQWRTAADRRHPANIIARERLLRAAVIAHPEMAGAASLAPVPSPLPTDDLRAPAPAGALGSDGRGEAVVAVCSAGVDVDLVPTAADIRLLHAPDARLVLVVPEADAYPLTRELAARLSNPAEVREVGRDWPRLVV